MLLSLRSGERLPRLPSGSFARRANRRHPEPDALPPYGDERLRFLMGFPFEVFSLRSGEKLPGLPCGGGQGCANRRHPEPDALPPYGDGRVAISDGFSLRGFRPAQRRKTAGFVRGANRRHPEVGALPPYGDERLRFPTGFPFEVFGLRSGERLPGLSCGGLGKAQAADFGRGYFPVQLLSDLRSRSAAQHSPDAKPAYSCMKNSACMSVRSVTAFPWKATAMRSCARCISTTWQ